MIWFHNSRMFNVIRSLLTFTGKDFLTSKIVWTDKTEPLRSHYLTISLSHYLTISLSHYLTISLSHYLTISLSHYPVIIEWQDSGSVGILLSWGFMILWFRNQWAHYPAILCFHPYGISGLGYHVILWAAYPGFTAQQDAKISGFRNAGMHGITA